MVCIRIRVNIIYACDDQLHESTSGIAKYARAARTVPMAVLGWWSHKGGEYEMNSTWKRDVEDRTADTLACDGSVGKAKQEALFA